MKRSVIILLFLIPFLTNSGSRHILAQEQKPQEAAVITESQEAAGLTESEEIPETIEPQQVLWLWGEVISVDPNARQMLVKYFDDETDLEKEISINVDDKTIFENVKSLDEIEARDTVSIDYVMNADGQNIARNINTEKVENRQVLPEAIPGEDREQKPQQAVPVQ